ncbi:MAG: hypothetical protein K8S99_07765 [Planctomycetes bacterium]|nr:hypothetical protein [Planctomycetota bacterium]
MAAQKSLDTKIARILADPSCKDFILADAKDADLAFGIAAPGKSPEHYAQEARFRSLAEFRELIRQNVKQGLLDIMLMSASTSELLTIKERLFDESHVTPAARANDATDIWAVQGGTYSAEPSRPFRTATIDHIMCGKVDCTPGERKMGADLGLYSVTFNNKLDTDLASVEAYGRFREEAERKGFRHFLEVFNPNACGDHCPTDLGRFVNDSIVRTLGGVVSRGRPLFLKIAYNGPEAMEQLAGYDRSLIVGILGGSAGTTFDAFHQLAEAKKYGARVALYGRMINNAENQGVFIQHLRWVADGNITDAAEAVKSYHGSLEKLGIRPYRSLQDDLTPTKRIASYAKTTARVDGGKPAVAATAPAKSKPAPAAGAPASSAAPDFSRMTPTEKVAWNLSRWNRVLR